MKQYKIKHLFNDSDGSDGYPQVWSGQTGEKDSVVIHYKYGELRVFVDSVNVLKMEVRDYIPEASLSRISEDYLLELLDISHVFVNLEQIGYVG
jgi:hypothetical protein